MNKVQILKEQIRHLDAEIRALEMSAPLTKEELQEINSLQDTKNDLICEMYETIGELK